LKIDKVKPHLTFKVWGGEKLKILKSPQKEGEASSDPLGETWEVSNHKDGPSTTIEGKSLKDLYNDSELPYLIKFIDTSDNLSVQVHPDDTYADNFEDDSGKTECWIILDAEPGAGIYLGFKEGVTKAALETAIEENKDVNDLLHFYEVKPGQFFFVPAKTIHAIGKGVTLAEVQQSSGITYRVWDWNRVGLDGKPRELHVDKALDVLNFEPEANTKEFFKYVSNIFEKTQSEVIDHPDFLVHSYSISSGEEIKVEGRNRVSSIVVLSGEVSCGEVSLKQFDCATISPDTKEFCVKIIKDAKFLIVR
jgi:mannose-6-phosphate isomerase